MIEWSQGAEQQLFEILLSFSTKTTFEKFEKQLNTALEQLETFPESARMNPVLYRSNFQSFSGRRLPRNGTAIAGSNFGVFDGAYAFWRSV